MTQTPAGVTILATRPDGTTVDVTAGVQVLYDHVIGSMDWGSGFLSLEDAVPIAEVAEVCGFEGIDEARRYLAEERHNEESKAYWTAHPESAAYNYPMTLHEHVYSSQGKCLWRMCGAKQVDTD